MPGGVPRTSTMALNKATLPLLLKLADQGYKKTLQENKNYFPELEDFADKIAKVLNRTPLTSLVRSAKIETIALCTGGGQGYIDLAAEQGIDAYLTGEASEQTIHSSREQNIDFFAAGHHATERYGVKALGELLAQEHGFDVTFIDIDNPV